MRSVWMVGGLRVDIHLGSADTGGQFALMVDHPPEGWALPSHAHAGESETVHVIDGTFAFVVDGVEHEVGPGETLHIPAGVPHSGRILGPLPGRRAVIFSPAGMEEFFLAAGTQRPGDPSDLATVLELAQRYGWTFTDGAGSSEP